MCPAPRGFVAKRASRLFERSTENSRAVSLVMESTLFLAVPHFWRRTGSTAPKNALGQAVEGRTQFKTRRNLATISLILRMAS